MKKVLSIILGTAVMSMVAHADQVEGMFESVRVKRIVANQEQEHILISAGANAGLVEGQILEAFRQVKQKDRPYLKIKTGVLKIVKVDQNESVAKSVEDGTNLSKVYFRKFPKMMTNDLIQPMHVEIVKTQKFSPHIVISYFDCFVDPKAYPSTYELTDAGRNELRAAAEQFMDAKVSTLLIEGHTDKQGPSAVNQVESYQRALAVRQYLIDEMGFDADRVVAVGMGESETPDDNMVPGYQRKHRRISFKILSEGEMN